MGVGDAQPHPVQPAGAQAAEELPPEALGLGLADVQADDLATAAVADAVGDHQRLVAHAARLAHPFDLGVQPQVGVGAGQGPLPEDTDLLVQAAAQPGDLVLGHALQAELGDQPVDLAGGDAVDVGLLPRPRPGPARPAGVAPRSRGSSCQRAAWGWPARAGRRGCPRSGAGSRCAGWYAGRGHARRAQRRSAWRPRRPSARRPATRCSRAARRRGRWPAACRPVGQRSSWAGRPSWCLLRLSAGTDRRS